LPRAPSQLRGIRLDDRTASYKLFRIHFFRGRTGLAPLSTKKELRLCCFKRLHPDRWPVDSGFAGQKLVVGRRRRIGRDARHETSSGEEPTACDKCQIEPNRNNLNVCT